MDKLVSITNDVLIGLSARQIGATVVTQNRRGARGLGFELDAAVCELTR